METDDLLRITARLGAATPGPWRVEARQQDPPEWYVVGDGQTVARCGAVDFPGVAHDASFIANARSDVESLLVEVGNQRHELHDLRELVADTARALGVHPAHIAHEAERTALEKSATQRGLDAVSREYEQLRGEWRDLKAELQEIRGQSDAVAEAMLAAMTEYGGFGDYLEGFTPEGRAMMLADIAAAVRAKLGP